MTCRVCGSNDTSILPIGKYAEFFLLRVDTTKDDFQLFSRADSIRINPTISLPVRAVRKIGRILRPTKLRPVVQFRTSMQACASCHGITPCHEYSFEDLSGLYHNYRSETYNRDRISVEPAYKRIANDVGSHSLEIKNRNAAVNSFLSRNVSHFAGGAMIDYGGNDGRFIPPFVYEQFEKIYIYDASDASLHSSVDARKIERIAKPRLEAYSFLTCMHVLEHVGNPRAFVVEAARHLVPGGLMYIEVPHELADSVREDFERKIIDTPITIHEHMNLFDRTSIRTLVGSIVGLELIDDAEDITDLGWISGLIGRFLVKKTK
jgi:SAM-dependent methyltransferase